MSTAAELVRRVREAYASDEGQRTGTTYTAPHAAAGSPTGGQFTSTNGSGSKKKKPPAKKKPAQSAAAPAAPKPSPALAYATQSYQDFGSISHRTAAGDPRITAVQTLMRSLGMPVPASGKFDPEMQAQVKAMQLKLGMSPTGRVTGSLMKTLQKAAILSPCAKESVTFSAADLVRRVREGWEDQRRAPQGTGIGGRWVRMGAVVAALRGAGHPEAAKALRANPPKASRRGSSRWSPSDREVRGHARAVAERNQLREQIARRDEDLKAPQFEGGRMSNPAERRKTEMERTELQRQLAEIEPRVAAGERNRALNPEAYADPLPGGDGPAAPGAAEPLSTDPAIRAVQVENRVRAAYAAAHARNPGSDWVGLADLRNELGESTNRYEVDDALRRLALTDGVNIVPESNQKMLREEDRVAAVTIGAQQKHAITMDDPSPRPLPGNDPATELTSIDAQIAAMTAGGNIDHLSLFQLQDRARELRPQVAASRTSRPQPTAYDASALSARDVEVDTRLRDAYAGMPKATGGWVGIADLRDAMGDIPRAEQDAALRRLADPNAPGKPRIIPVANTKALEPRDRAAAVRIGDEDSHTVTFQEPVGSSDRQAELDDEAFANEMAAELDAEFDPESNLAATEFTPSPAPRKAAKAAPLSALDAQGRVVPLPSKEERDRAILGDKEYERRQGAAKPAKKTAAAKVAAAKAASATTPRADLGAMSPAELRAADVNGDADLESALAGRSLSELRSIAYDANVSVPSGSRHTVGGVRQALMDEVRDVDRRNPSTEGRREARLLGVANATPRARPAKKTAAAKVKAAKVAAPSTVDHAARVMEFQDGDSVVRYLAESKLTIPQLKALGNELGGSLVNMRGSKQQLMERIGAHVGDRHRPIMGFASDWARGTPTPVAPSAPVELSDAEKARRAEILSRPLSQPRAMRPEDGAGVFSADPEIQARAARILDDQLDARRALQASMESPPKKSAAARVKAAKAAPTKSLAQVIADYEAEGGMTPDEQRVKDAALANLRIAAPEGRARQAEWDAVASDFVLLQHQYGAQLSQARAAYAAGNMESARSHVEAMRTQYFGGRSHPQSEKAQQFAALFALTGSPASPTPSAPAPRTAAEKVAAARAQPYSAANMTTVGSDPGDVAARIDRARDAAAIDAEMTGMTVADLRKVARELSMPLPAAPSGKWTPESLREYIAMIHLRERGRWNLR